MSNHLLARFPLTLQTQFWSLKRNRSETIYVGSFIHYSVTLGLFMPGACHGTTAITTIVTFSSTTCFPDGCFLKSQGGVSRNRKPRSSEHSTSQLITTHLSMYGWYISCGVSKDTFELPHKISYPYIEICDFHTMLKMEELWDLTAHSHVWSNPKWNHE